MADIWVRVDANLARNHKIIDLVSRRRWQAISLYVFALGYSAEQGLDGYVPEAALPFVHGTRAIANHLVDVGLWIPAVGGWDIHDYADYQRTSAETEARKARAKAAAEVRWAKKRQANVTKLTDHAEKMRNA